jgi:hypothetical protein
MTQSSKKKTRASKPVDKTAETRVSEPSGSDLDTVREILFGAQVQQHNQKQDELKQYIDDSIAQLNAETEKRFTKIEAKITKLNDSFKDDSKLRNKAETQFHKELQSLLATIEQLDSTTSDSNTDLQDQLLNQADDMQKQLDALHAEMSNALQLECAKLNRDKADRSSLAVLLNGIATELSETNSASDQLGN